ncbi:MAG: hypothetical protein CL561_09420 [Alphaproteobacteria bacterium]|nr:hypothetical protein [Alphaproteobacteria bacterium]
MNEGVENNQETGDAVEQKTKKPALNDTMNDFLTHLGDDNTQPQQDAAAEVETAPIEPPEAAAQIAEEPSQQAEPDEPAEDAELNEALNTLEALDDIEQLETAQPQQQAAPVVSAPDVPSSGSQKIPGVYKPAAVSTNATLTNAVASGVVTKETLLTLGMDHLNRGAQNVYSAQKDAVELRTSYEKAARQHGRAKWAMLAAETTIMGVFSYDMIEDWNGFADPTSAEAIAANTALTGGVAGLRAYVQYEMMKRGEDALKKGQKIQGALFSAIGLAIAAANAIFVTYGFGKRSIEQTQDIAMAELDQISDKQAEIFSEKTAAQEEINKSIDALDQKILEIQSGARDPSITAVDEEMQRLEKEIQNLNNDPAFSDGRETEADRIIRKEIARNSAELNNLSQRKAELLSNVGKNLSPEMQRMFEATTNQRLDLDEQIKTLDTRYKPQLDALQASRNVWEAKLASATSGGDDVFKAMFNNPIVLLEGVVMGAGISIANWAAAHQGQKQEEFEHILAGKADNPWANQKKANDNDPLASDFGAASKPAQMFMGYNFAADRSESLRNESQINVMANALKNPEAMRIELRSELTRQHGKMVAVLNEQFAQLPEDLYVQRLNAINAAYQQAAEAVEGHEVLAQLEDLISSESAVPTFEDPNDPAFKALPSGKQFKTPDGKIMLKV